MLCFNLAFCTLHVLSFCLTNRSCRNKSKGVYNKQPASPVVVRSLQVEAETIYFPVF